MYCNMKHRAKFQQSPRANSARPRANGSQATLRPFGLQSHVRACSIVPRCNFSERHLSPRPSREGAAAVACALALRRAQQVSALCLVRRRARAPGLTAGLMPKRSIKIICLVLVSTPSTQPSTRPSTLQTTVYMYGWLHHSNQRYCSCFEVVYVPAGAPDWYLPAS